MAMTMKTHARSLEIVREIQHDMELDTMKWEGAAVTGANIAEMLGEIRGTIAGLAGVVERVLQAAEVEG
jgi:hypothetical protein